MTVPAGTSREMKDHAVVTDGDPVRDREAGSDGDVVSDEDPAPKIAVDADASVVLDDSVTATGRDEDNSADRAVVADAHHALVHEDRNGIDGRVLTDLDLHETPKTQHVQLRLEGVVVHQSLLVYPWFLRLRSLFES